MVFRKEGRTEKGSRIVHRKDQPCSNVCRHSYCTVNATDLGTYQYS
jgi:hypothetical protein